jgi:hypothetical protein
MIKNKLETLKKRFPTKDDIGKCVFRQFCDTIDVFIIQDVSDTKVSINEININTKEVDHSNHMLFKNGFGIGNYSWNINKLNHKEYKMTNCCYSIKKFRKLIKKEDLKYCPNCGHNHEDDKLYAERMSETVSRLNNVLDEFILSQKLESNTDTNS